MKTNAASKTPRGKDGRVAEVQALLALTNSSSVAAVAKILQHAKHLSNVN